MGLAEALVEELLMQFGQRRPLELTSTSTGNGTKFGGFVFGVNDRLVREFLDGFTQSVVLRSHNVDVKFDVVAHDIRRTS